MKYFRYYLIFKITLIIIVAKHIMSLTIASANLLSDSTFGLVLHYTNSILLILIFAVYFFTDSEV